MTARGPDGGGDGVDGRHARRGADVERAEVVGREGQIEVDVRVAVDPDAVAVQQHPLHICAKV
jgi:hypothetical protein